MGCVSTRTIEAVKGDIKEAEARLEKLREELKKLNDILESGSLYQHAYDRNVRILLKIDSLYYLVHIHPGPNNFHLIFGTGGYTVDGKTEEEMKNYLAPGSVWKKISGRTDSFPKSVSDIS